MQPAAVRDILAHFPQAPFFTQPSPVEELPRLREALAARPRLVIKRDDAIPFGFGGNKVRKLAFVAARAQADGADLLVTCGGVQSNHARVTAAAAAKLGMRAALVVNGAPPEARTGNALLDRMLGAELHYVNSREDRDPGMERVARAARGRGRRPFIIPLGASTPLGALGFVRAVAELAEQMEGPPDVIFHASSSGGTQAGIVSGCRALDWPTRVIGISADEPAAPLCATVQSIVDGIATLAPGLAPALATGTAIEVDDRFVGTGYGIPTPESDEAQELAAEREAIILDSTYTAKAMAGLIAHVRSGALDSCRTILFWHTGGQPAVFA